MDENFSSPGGGFVNLDFYGRMVCSPGVNLVTMLGRGVVSPGPWRDDHQRRRTRRAGQTYEDEYAELRGAASTCRSSRRATSAGCRPPPAASGHGA